MIVRRETPLALYKGLGAVLSGIVPKMAIRFASFERYKAWLADKETGVTIVGNIFICECARSLGKSGVGGGRASGRTPRVEGRVIRSAASDESIYIVNARGGGATKWLRSCTESCKFEVDWDAWCWR